MTKLLILLSLVLAAQVSTAQETKKVIALEWEQLVPQNWQPPILEPAPDEDGHQHTVDKAALVQGLDKKPVMIPGYMIPTKVENQKLVEFLLVPFLEIHVKEHMHHRANQMIYVKLSKPMDFVNPMQPYWAIGQLLVESHETDEGLAGYVLVNASAEEYKF